MLNILEKGAVADGKSVNTDSIQSALDACDMSGGGTVVVPPGHFVSGPLHLRSNVELRIAPGALLEGMRDIDGWAVVSDPWAGGESENTNVPNEERMYAPFLYGDGLENVSITGGGILDGGGDVWWEQYRTGKLPHRRPRLIAPSNCVGVRIEGITCRNPAQWTISPVCCDRVWICGVRIENPPDSPNTDGINPDSCRFVHISDCHLDVGDDCVTLKSGTEKGSRPSDRPCENITITNCTMVHGHGGVVCGSEMSRDIRNVAISNCIFKGTDRGLRFKSRRGRGGIIENVRVNNVVMEDVPAPFVMNLFYHCGARGEARVTDGSQWPVDDRTPRLERLRFSHITVRNAQWAGIFAHGLPEMPIRDLLFHDVDIQMREDAGEGTVAMAGNVGPMRRRGVFLRHVRGARFESVRLQGEMEPTLDQDGCRDIAVSNCSW